MLTKKSQLHGKMSIGTAEKVLTGMLNIPDSEVVIRNVRTKRDIKDNAKINALRTKNHSLILNQTDTCP